jgi:hypothetical protein
MTSSLRTGPERMYLRKASTQGVWMRGFPVAAQRAEVFAAGRTLFLYFEDFASAVRRSA